MQDLGHQHPGQPLGADPLPAQIPFPRTAFWMLSFRPMLSSRLLASEWLLGTCLGDSAQTAVRGKASRHERLGELPTDVRQAYTTSTSPCWLAREGCWAASVAWCW